MYFLRIKPNKWLKSKKYADFGCRLVGKISVQLEDKKYYQNEKTLKYEKFLIIFIFLIQILEKVIIIFF